MDEIKTYKDLKKSIEDLEIKQSQDFDLVKSDFHDGIEKLKPVNLLKGLAVNTIETLRSSEGLTITALGLFIGYVSKKIFIGTSHSLPKKIAGTMLLIGMNHIVTQHPEKVKLVGHTVLKLFRKMIGERKE